jgi:hypothetical protein
VNLASSLGVRPFEWLVSVRPAAVLEYLLSTTLYPRPLFHHSTVYSNNLRLHLLVLPSLPAKLPRSFHP